MPRFFIKPEGETAELGGETARHLAKSLRIKTGDEITLCDGEGLDYVCAVSNITDKAVTVRVLERRPNTTEPAAKITLFQCLPKGDKLDTIVRQATELGVYEIVPVLSRFCVSRKTPEDFEKQRERLQKIALSAAEQSGRGIIPEVRPLIKIEQCAELLPTFDKALFFYEGGGVSVREALEGTTDSKLQVAHSKPQVAHSKFQLAVVIGSEGGFSKEEAGLITASGAAAVTLGPRILRCETAPVAALSVLLSELER